ncbi:MAG: ribonuclease R [Bacteroidetes bacterium]|nr:MAG: ribonuclease R [Bacteroidota bacterium]
MDRSQLRARVTAYFDRHPGGGFKSRDLRRRLQIEDEHEFEVLRDILHKMVAKQELAWTKKQGYHRIPRRAAGIAGVIHITRQGAGTVTTEDGVVVTVDKRSLGTAFNGDTVEVALLAARKRRKEENDPPEGEVIRVLRRARTTFIGTLEKSSRFHFVLPDDGTVQRDLYIDDDSVGGAQPGEKVVAELVQWDDPQLNPEGRIVTVLGPAGDPFVEIRSVLEKYRLTPVFPPAVEEEVSRIPEAVPAAEIAKRLDLRRAVIVTIDPHDAKDFDDALSIEPLGGGSVRLGVHIADVSAYVKEGTALDDEAFARGTSVYMANQVVPMLPEKLSNRLCSLMPKVDRLAFSCFMTVDAKGKVTEHSFARSVINSKRRFTYEEVEAVLDTGQGDHAEELKALWALASLLRKKRMKNGSIDFDAPEAKFRYDERGKPVEILLKKRLKSHQLVEECMLLANQTVAVHVSSLQRKKETLPFVYRVHDVPNPDKLRALAEFVSKLGHPIRLKEKTTAKELQHLLAEVEGTKEENLIHEVALRSMAKAVYSDENIGHFGLAFSHYTHFTSPIRRYPDLIVHRMLDEYLNGMSEKRRDRYAKELGEQCRHCSDRERVATEAERDSVKVMQVEYMRQHVGERFAGIVSGVMQFGLFVELDGLLVEGLVHVREMGNDYYTYDERQYALIGQRSGARFRLGDPLTVTVSKVDPERRTIDFVLEESNIVRKGRERTGRRRN